MNESFKLFKLAPTDRESDSSEMRKVALATRLLKNINWFPCSNNIGDEYMLVAIQYDPRVMTEVSERDWMLNEAVEQYRRSGGNRTVSYSIHVNGFLVGHKELPESWNADTVRQYVLVSDDMEHLVHHEKLIGIVVVPKQSINIFQFDPHA